MNILSKLLKLARRNTQDAKIASESNGLKSYLSAHGLSFDPDRASKHELEVPSQVRSFERLDVFSR